MVNPRGRGVRPSVQSRRCVRIREDELTIEFRLDVTINVQVGCDWVQA
ncbi:MAG: hypothetical protein ACFE89_01195 [Candidatus Hodarchaeota archaeon]